jgi:hypothetical protein
MKIETRYLVSYRRPVFFTQALYAASTHELKVFQIFRALFAVDIEAAGTASIQAGEFISLFLCALCG